MNKFVLASLLGAAVMFAGQAPATSSKAQTNSSQPATATTKVKKHHKKNKTAPAASTSATPSKPVAKQ
ncbi:MAG TPA: hypothetical protein VNX70_17295 [Bryobacteraceae bacterium]|nr:hypothetical protein [Bryobacteraceae bacterium]